MKFLDLFSGIGGFRLGLERAGHECVGYVEWDKYARQSYEAIHNTEGEWTRNDITAVTDSEWRELRGKVDIIAGGFPCQSFSIAGKREGFADKTKGTLFFEIARAAKQIQPQFLFLENVKGLLNSKTTLTFCDIIEILNHEIVGGTLWEEEFLPIDNWSTLRNNISHYLSEELQMNLIFQNLKLDTSLKKNSKLVYEMSETKVGDGLMRRLKYLEIQISQILKKQNNYQVELMQRLEGKGEDWDSNLKKLFSIENIKTVDTSMLEKIIVTNGEIELLLNEKSEESLKQAKLFITSTESKQTIDQAICTFVQELNILLFIIKQWKLSTNLWKKIMSDLMKKKGSMYYVGTFNIIINTLDELGYDAEWQLLNSKDFGVPQNRERVFIIGHLRNGRGREIFPIQGSNGSVNQNDIKAVNDSKKIREQIGFESVNRFYDVEGISPCLNTMSGGGREPKIMVPKEEFGRMGRQAVETFNKNNCDFGNTINPFNKTVDESGLSPTLTTRPEGFKTAILPITHDYRIRKLTPLECWRLQGFPDEAFRAAEQVNSNSQLYKQAGNSVTVNVIYEIAKRIKMEENK